MENAATLRTFISGRNPTMRAILLSVGCLVLAMVARAQDGPSKTGLGEKVGNVKLHRLDGKVLALHDLKGAKAIVVVFLTFDCPVSNSYLTDLSELAKTHKDVPFLGVCPSADELSQLAGQAEKFQVGFPVVADPKLRAVRALNVGITPEACVLDGDMVLRYRGRIDDGFSARLKKNKSVTRHDLREALAEVLAGKPVSQPVTPAVGCPIAIATPAKASTSLTYYKDVLPILQNRCQGCHRPGEAGPFSLMTYEQAVHWADDIKEYTTSRAMPPWKPTEGVAFRGERKLSDAEIATLAAWVDGGRPPGEPRDAPPPVKFREGWSLGQPDLILMAKEDFTLGATGSDLFRCFVFPTDLPEDKFVRAYEVRPGARQAVHHTLHFLDTQGRGRKLEEKERNRPRRPDEKDAGPGYNMRMHPGFVPDGDIGGWAPGITPQWLGGGPDDEIGYFLPRKADVVVQIHYHRTGKVEKDRTQIGLYFSKKPNCKPLQSMVVAAPFLSIPAGKEDFRVKGSVWAAQDCTLYNVTPHMHLIGKTTKITMTPPDGPSKTLVGIKSWDFNWQEIYMLKEPIRVKENTRFDLEASYDNSAKNPANPFSPPRTIRLGESTNNEMCLGFLDCVSDDGRRVYFRAWPGGLAIPHVGVLPKTTPK
jgi:peroxiredoxin/mono/diheme cytochrome c family protein